MAIESHRERAKSAQTEKDTSGPTQSPLKRTVSLRLARCALLAETVPSITSEWPPIYFVPAWIERSTPKSSGR